MRYLELNTTVDVDKFKKAFVRFVSTNALELEYGELYGFIGNKTFSIFSKTKPHTFISCIEEYLYGELDANGTIRYVYKRSWMAICFSRIAPIISLVVGIIGYLATHTVVLLVVPIVMSLYFAIHNLLKPYKLRDLLYATLSRVVEKANE